jgi:hypothetical protein
MYLSQAERILRLAFQFVSQNQAGNVFFGCNDVDIYFQTLVDYQSFTQILVNISPYQTLLEPN